ncbi:hypothetical protein MGN70_000116 [Eutypa lata]|uniref:Transmembrane protein n=1 Tax=Eutypa lata (strain UCR-EL1) TaxID=1287681 RepID=M7T142_EUTLA|nr:hypothetical protein UCREL1_2704 [Eutypa lata UCREL1]KAI1257077.1 hypothetical protein MGN70_000116 [Eutypa lata]
MATTTAADFPLATTDPYVIDNDHGSANAGGEVNDAAGAAGSSPGVAQISQGALIAIIVVVSVVGALGISTAVLFYLAKKREWKVRENLRRSARKVVTALTPRRSEFPKSVKESGKSSRGRVRLDDVPPTPRLRPEDLEKGLQTKVRQSPEGRSKKWPRK